MVNGAHIPIPRNSSCTRVISILFLDFVSSVETVRQIMSYYHSPSYRHSRRHLNNYKEILKELRLRIETNDPLYPGQKKLKMRGKDLQDLPNVLFKLMELEVLDLSPERQAYLDFRLPRVPKSIGKLINLRCLMLDTNDLRVIPKEITLLQSLERLSLSNNKLASLPHGFQMLEALRSLHMANNRFETFPVDVCTMKGLEFLDMSDNYMIIIPEEVSDLQNLTTLILSYNKLIRLPDGMCKLTGLECLWLSNNRLHELPRNFGKLTRLDWGYRYTSSVLECNPLTHPPIEICRLGPKAIEDFFESLEDKRVIETPDIDKELEQFVDDETNVNTKDVQMHANENAAPTTEDTTGFNKNSGPNVKDKAELKLPLIHIEDQSNNKTVINT